MSPFDNEYQGLILVITVIILENYCTETSPARTFL